MLLDLIVRLTKWAMLEQCQFYNIAESTQSRFKPFLIFNCCLRFHCFGRLTRNITSLASMKYDYIQTPAPFQISLIMQLYKWHHKYNGTTGLVLQNTFHIHQLHVFAFRYQLMSNVL
jgi:hypothetical protein